MSDLDLSAGGFPESTYVGKNTTVADVARELERLRTENASLRSAAGLDDAAAPEDGITRVSLSNEAWRDYRRSAQ